MNKKQMESVSLGIAAEMTAKDRAVLIGDNGKTGDQRVRVWAVRGVRVASTNGNPVWEEQDFAIFAELLESEGIKLRGAPRKTNKRPMVSYTVALETAAAIDADRREGESKGMVLDRWAKLFIAAGEKCSKT